jgi:ergothioneine biosynthesis protein EgtB
VREIEAYRFHVDRHMIEWLQSLNDQHRREFHPLIEIGLHHEQQHQELMLTDIKHVFWVNPLRPAYRERKETASAEVPPMRWVSFDEGVVQIGHEGSSFAFDNESPRHREFVEAFDLASRPVTNREYLRFIEDKGYERIDLWLSMGAAWVRQEQARAPLYWISQDGQWLHHTLAGLRPIDLDEPVCHVNYFEADAYARWAGARLPTEAEWELAATSTPGVSPESGNFVEDELYHPAPARATAAPLGQMFGDVWEWTLSSYAPYPGYAPPAGALGEYNGKFMCNQYVLRGGSCATPRSHIRATYRNFFPPDARWQFMGIRLARAR